MIWVVGAMIAAACAALATRPLWRRGERAASRAAHDVAHYRAQIEELERDVERGAFDAQSAEAARRELSRKLLAAADALEEEQEIGAAPTAVAQGALIGVACAVALGGLGLYAALGAPELPDAPLAGRDFANERRDSLPLQAVAEAAAAAQGDRAAIQPPPDIAPIIARLEQTVEQRPTDASARILLAETYIRLGRETEAWPLLAEAATTLGEAAEPDLHARQAEAMILAAGGAVSQEAREALDRADGAPRARFYLGLAEAQSQDYLKAVATWADLYRDYPDAPFAPTLLEQIRQTAPFIDADPERLVAAVRQGAGQGAGQVAGQGATPAPGPDVDDVAAAAQMSEEDRRAMIEGMVANLAARLAQAPDDLDGWSRLVRSYMVLDEPEKARAAYAAAQETFAGNADALGALSAAAEAAGLEP